MLHHGDSDAGQQAQDQAGCGATWDPACEAPKMIKGDDGLYTYTTIKYSLH